MQHTPSPHSVKTQQTTTSMRRDSTVSKIGNHERQERGREPRGAQQRHEKPRREDKPGRRPEFDQEYEGKTVKVTLYNGATILGKAETSKYWLKIHSASGKCIYVNKAYVVLIEPAE